VRSLNSTLSAANAKEGTQLAEAVPQLDMPQRIDAPETVQSNVLCHSETTA
jgi:hypothetical protein